MSGNYAAWVTWLEAFRRGENPPTEGLAPISPALGSYVEARLLERVSAAFVERVRQWQTVLGDRIVERPPDGPAAASAMLREAVGRLEPLARLATSPLLPRSLGRSMHEMLGTVRDGARTALEDAWRRHLDDPVGSAVPPQRRGSSAGAVGIRPGRVPLARAASGAARPTGRPERAPTPR